MIVIVNEKPSQARNFAKALGGRSGKLADGRDYRICALRGHIMGLDKSDKLSHQVDDGNRARYASWDPAALPWSPEDLSWSKAVTAPDVLDELKDSLSDADEVCIATDVDPSGEGELLAWEALERAGWTGRTYRAYFADEAAPSVKKAVADMKELPGMKQDGDFAKARARERWDFLSMQFTRAATAAARTRGHRTVVRQGRLKSVMVSLVGKQLDEIAAYKKVPYYEARFRDANGNVYKLDDPEGHRFKEKEHADFEAASLKQSDVAEDSRELKKKAPGKLLDLAGLSAILARRGIDPDAVLSTYQKMYEDQVVSYPRTEDKKITHEQFDELLPDADEIAAVVGVDTSLLTHREPRRTHVAEGGAHGANRPGPNVPDSLGELDVKYGRGAADIYKVLALSYLAMLAEDYEYFQIKAHVVDYEDYKTVARVPVTLGYRAVLDTEAATKDDEDDEQGGEPASPAVPFTFEGSNKKPPYPTMKWLMKKLEKYDVGTGATRTSTLAEITDARDQRALMSQKKGKLSLTEIGRVSYKLLDGCEIASPEVTEQLFREMAKVGSFETTEADLLATCAPMVVHDRDRMLENAKALPMAAAAQATVVGKCPVCGADAMLKQKSVQCSTNKYKKEDDGSWTLAEGSCGWRIPRTVAHKLLTEKQVEAVLAGKKPKVAGLVSKSGKKFEARLVLDGDGRIGFSFDNMQKKGRSGSGARSGAYGRAGGFRGYKR